jgi:hypothetical protein
MITNPSSANILVSNNFYQKFVVYDAKGNVDVKKSVAFFQENFTEWLKSQGDLKPAIIAELQQYGQLGEGKLVNFTLHALRLQPSKDNVERITTALQELERAGKVVYKTTQEGTKRGRGTGWSLAEGATPRKEKETAA